MTDFTKFVIDRLFERYAASSYVAAKVRIDTATLTWKYSTQNISNTLASTVTPASCGNAGELTCTGLRLRALYWAKPCGLGNPQADNVGSVLELQIYLSWKVQRPFISSRWKYRPPMRFSKKCLPSRRCRSVIFFFFNPRGKLTEVIWPFCTVVCGHIFSLGETCHGGWTFTFAFEVKLWLINNEFSLLAGSFSFDCVLVWWGLVFTFLFKLQRRLCQP